MIEVKNLTLKYPNGKGVFDINFSVSEGEAMGYLGPNGAGKTTTIRGLLGFMKPNNGSCSIRGLDCASKAPEIQKTLGYMPGEMTFLEDMNGDEFLRLMQELRGVKDTTLQKRLLDMFELNPKGRIKKFSKGMKQKLGIVTAFMHDPDVLILDEPTSGLDPLMQNRFIMLILEEKARGKTILMSSHIFEEVEKTCDNILIIKDGRIVKQSDVKTLKGAQRKGFIIKTENINSTFEDLEKAGFDVVNSNGDTIEVFVKGESIDFFVKTLAKSNTLSFDAKTQSLEDVFMHFYRREEK